MAVTAYSKKCTSCGGNRWEYLKDQKLWRCLYCGAQVERKEEYDGLYTIKNVARQVVLDCAYRKLDQADHNLTECLKMSADYAGTLVASICYKLIAVVSPEQLPGQDKRALLGQLKRDYQTLEQTCGKLGDDETELYASFDSSDAWAALAAVFDTIGDTQRRDYLLTLTQPEQIYSKHTNQSLLRMSLRQGRRELADAILRNRENLDLHAACLTVMQEAPDDQDKAGWLESLIDAGSLGEKLCAALEDCRAVFVVGGLGLDIERNPAEILSRAVSAERVDDYKRIKNNAGADGYYLKAGDSSLVLLPDDPKQIKEMLSNINIFEAISA